MAEECVADSENDWRNDPVAVHILTLASGKTIKIEMYYDRRQLFHCDVNDFKVVTNLNDLSSNFEFVEESDKWFMTNLSLHIGGTDWKMSNRSRSVARFRFGPQIAQSMGENEVEGYGTLKTLGRCQPELVTTVRMEVSKDEDPLASDYTAADVMKKDFLDFIDNISARKFLLGMDAVSTSPEIFSLHSEYFCTLFYRHFEERNKNSIEIQDMDKKQYDELKEVLILPKNFLLEPYIDLDLLPTTFRLLDRFSCIDLFKKVEMISRSLIDRWANENSFHWIIGLGEVLNDNLIMVKYLNRFPLAECLNSLTKENANVMTPISTPLLTQRMTSVCNEMSSRPRIRFVFTQGEVVCSLFGDSQSQPLTHFLNFIRGGNAVTDKDVKRIGNGNARLCLIEPLQYAVDGPPPLFASSPTLLHYGTYNYHPRLLFLEYDYIDGHIYPVMGVVLSGKDILPTVTKLLSISIVS